MNSSLPPFGVAVDRPDRVCQLVVELRGELVLVGLVGEHDIATCEETLELLRGLTALGSGGVVIDVTETEFLDLSAVRTLLTLDRELRAAGRRLVIAGGQRSSVRLVLELSGAVRKLACVAALEDAVSLARGEPVVDASIEAMASVQATAQGARAMAEQVCRHAGSLPASARATDVETPGTKAQRTRLASRRARRPP